MAALLHDIGKPLTQSTDEAGAIHFYTHEVVGADLAAQRLAELRFSNEETKRAAAIIRHHMRPLHMARAQAPAVSRRAIYRFFRDTRAAGVDIALVSLADYWAHFGGNPPPADLWERRLSISAQLLNAYFENHAEMVSPSPLVTGQDLMQALGLKPGPQLGELLEAVREAQATGEVKDKAAALEFAKRRLESQQHVS